MHRVKLLPNVPILLSLNDPTGELDSRTGEVSYPTSDGRTLLLSYKQAVTLNELGLKAGEEFSALLKVDEHGFKTFIPSLSPRAEQERAAVEAPELERQLAQSIAAIPQIVRKAPTKASEPAQAPLTFDRGTGTHGPAPARVAIPKAAPAHPRIPYQIAVREVVHTVKSVLDAEGEQWNDGAKQDLVSTILIQAAKEGRIVFQFGESA